MRDPNRLDRFYDEVKKIHKKSTLGSKTTFIRMCRTSTDSFNGKCETSSFK